MRMSNTWPLSPEPPLGQISFNSHYYTDQDRTRARCCIYYDNSYLNEYIIYFFRQQMVNQYWIVENFVTILSQQNENKFPIKLQCFNQTSLKLLNDCLPINMHHVTCSFIHARVLWNHKTERGHWYAWISPVLSRLYKTKNRGNDFIINFIIYLFIYLRRASYARVPNIPQKVSFA